MRLPLSAIYLPVLSALFLVAACAAPAPDSDNSDDPMAEAAPTEMALPAPDLAELGNATYMGVADEPVTLVDGEWSGEPYVEGGAARPRVGLADFLLVGDLDGDGREESTVIVWTSSGGSGTFDYLAVMRRGPTDIETLGAAELGDRVKIRTAVIEDGAIVLETLEAGPEDAMCCPGQNRRRTFALVDDGLSEVATEDQGRSSVDDLQGVEWVLTAFGRDEPAPEEPVITLQVDGESISGSSGCNRYQAGITGDEMPGVLSVSPAAGTMMACPEEIMEMERRYLEALSAANAYSFALGELVLSWTLDDNSGALFFEPASP